MPPTTPKTIAAALMAAGQSCRTSVTGEPRGPLCGMGICFECRATVHGVPHQRTCQLALPQHSPQSPHPPSPIPHSPSPHSLLVVGAGPAGLSAAATAAEAGLAVTLLDDNPALGGQIWRGPMPEAEPWLERLHSAGVQILSATRIVDAPASGHLRAERAGQVLDLEYRQLVLATGARERFLPFPGWTLPHVLGAGGLQAMAKAGLPIAGKRVVIAGTGPLLIAVAAYLRQHGAQVLALAEQASPAALARFTAQLRLSKIAEGLRFARILRGVPVYPGAWPVEAQPGGVRLSVRGRIREFACDYIGSGFHLVPNTELAQMLGCATQNGSVLTNDQQQTTVPGVFCAGEPTGIGGLERALLEGAIAGAAAAGRQPTPAQIAERDRLRRFAHRLDRVTALRPELRSLPRPDTFVCRCEDVSFERIREAAALGGWRAAKLLTRCGMGPCQARVCGPALEFLLATPPDGLRPPLFPTPLSALC